MERVHAWSAGMQCTDEERKIPVPQKQILSVIDMPWFAQVGWCMMG